MKLSVLAVLYGNLPFKEALAKLKEMGAEAVEIGAGGYPGKAHCNPAELLADPAKYDEFKKTIDESGLEVCALASHHNGVHPDSETAKKFDDDFRNAVLLAEKLGVDTIITFSGCPGTDPDAKYPSWVTCPWPDDFLAVLDYQWKVLVDYWVETARFAKSHGVTKIALEMHPGFCVYNPETCMKLRRLVGEADPSLATVIGANLDPSHLVWQGIDVVAAIRYLGDAIYHFHAKDTKIDELNTGVNGVLDTKHYGDEIHRAWVFRSVGFGHGEQFWRDVVSNLRLVGYDKVLSIEHEDSLMTPDEGLSKAIALLKNVMIREPKPGGMFWA
jgi:sugar phosphate isomerase/epimerase